MIFRGATTIGASVVEGILLTITVALAYLAFLCLLDVYFVMYANEERGWYNKAAFLVFTLPIVLAGVGYRLQPRPNNIIFAFVAAPVGLAISYLELLWVATEFHTMIGGKI